MIHLMKLREQTLGIRAMCAKVAESEKARADVIPPTWKNNVRWHIGHLVQTPRLLTLGLLKEPTGTPEEFRKWFAKGSSPADWGSDTIPSLDELLGMMESRTAALFDELKGREHEAFPQAYTTSLGVVLSTPAESLVFSQAHDGIHLGLLLALKRSLNA